MEESLLNSSRTGFSLLLQPLFDLARYLAEDGHERHQAEKCTDRLLCYKGEGRREGKDKREKESVHASKCRHLLRRRVLLLPQCLPDTGAPLALQVDALLEDVVLDVEEFEFRFRGGGVHGRAGAGHADLVITKGEVNIVPTRPNLVRPAKEKDKGKKGRSANSPSCPTTAPSSHTSSSPHPPAP